MMAGRQSVPSSREGTGLTLQAFLFSVFLIVILFVTKLPLELETLPYPDSGFITSSFEFSTELALLLMFLLEASCVDSWLFSIFLRTPVRYLSSAARLGEGKN